VLGNASSTASQIVLKRRAKILVGTLTAHWACLVDFTTTP